MVRNRVISFTSVGEPYLHTHTLENAVLKRSLVSQGKKNIGLDMCLEGSGFRGWSLFYWLRNRRLRLGLKTDDSTQ